MSIAICLNNNGQQVQVNGFCAATMDCIADTYPSILEVRKHVRQALPKENGTYTIKRQNRHSGAFRYANAKTKAFWPFDYFDHNINFGDNLNINLDVLTGINGQYAPQHFVLNNARSNQLWDKLDGSDVSFKRQDGKMFMVLVDDNTAIELTAYASH